MQDLLFINYLKILSSTFVYFFFDEIICYLTKTDQIVTYLLSYLSLITARSTSALPSRFPQRSRRPSQSSLALAHAHGWGGANCGRCFRERGSWDCVAERGDLGIVLPREGS